MTVHLKTTYLPSSNLVVYLQGERILSSIADVDHNCGDAIKYLQNRFCNTHVDIPTNLATPFSAFVPQVLLFR